MKKIGIYYGSTAGTTEEIAKTIATVLNVADTDIHDVSNFSEESIDAYEVLLLGSSTWGEGDIQDDWFTVLQSLSKMDLSGKKVAFFGCGDSSSYPDSFCGAMGQMYNEIKDTGAKFIGSVSTDGYTFDESEAVVDGKFIGLPLDEENEDEKSAKRITDWIESIKPELN